GGEKGSRGGAAVGQDVDSRVRDRNGVLEMGGGLVVFGHHRPAVVKQLHIPPTGDNHRLDRQRHAGLKLEISPQLLGCDEVGDFGVFVHLSADAVADELADYAEAVGLDVILHEPGDLRPALVGLHVLDGDVERVTGDIEKLLADGIDSADGDG